MTVEEKFYILVMDEIRAQPGLTRELGFDLEGYAQTFCGCPLDQALTRLDQRGPCAGGLGFTAVDKLGPQPAGAARGVGAIRHQQGDLSYDGLCRGALLNLLWRDRARAEEKINLAKYLRDDWAFAHYLYGLLRGVDGDVGKAHFELYLAINRETFACAKQRIDRALSLVR
jgi:hypothetical protein